MPELTNEELNIELAKDFVKIRSIFHEEQSQCVCPICGYECIQFNKTIKPNFDNEKSNGIVLQYFCLCGHIFYIVIENYKGNSHMTYTDKNFNIIKPVVPEIIAGLDELSMEILKNLGNLTLVQKSKLLVMIDDMRKGA